MTHILPLKARPEVVRSAALRLSGFVQPSTWPWVTLSARYPVWLVLVETCLVPALALLVVASADAGARLGATWADTIFWAGLLVLAAPIALWLAMPDVRRPHALGLVTALGLGLYLIKVLHSPLNFTLYDEFLHWRTASDMLATGRLYSENPLLSISPLYPGLELATHALVTLGGLSIFQAGLVVIGAARLMLSLAVYLFLEQVSGSVRVAGLASLFYTAHPQFLFFNAQYAYQSLALSLALLTLWLLLRRQQAVGAEGRLLLVLAAASIVAVVVTHHITAYVLTGCLILWTTLAALRKGWRTAATRDVRWMALLAVVANLVWLVAVSSRTLDYLGPPLVDAVHKVLQVAFSEGGFRPPFQSDAGTRPPLLEQVVGLGSAVLIVLGLPFGLWHVWRRYADNLWAVLLAGAALAYPLSLPLRLIGSWEVGARASAFLFIGVGLLLALALERMTRPGRLRALRISVVVGYFGVVFAGGVISGVAPISRLPGPYLVGTTPRSVDSQGMAAAEWAYRQLGPGNRLVADHINTALMGSYGQQRVVTYQSDNVPAAPLFLAAGIGAYQRDLIRQGRIHYAVVDYRLTQALPIEGHYYEKWEKLDYPYSEPIERDVLAKFDRIPRVSRIFDAGDIVIYDIGALADEP